MSQLRGILLTARAIIWAKQIERQLLIYMKRVKGVLGRGLEIAQLGFLGTNVILLSPELEAFIMQRRPRPMDFITSMILFWESWDFFVTINDFFTLKLTYSTSWRWSKRSLLHN
ncbi:hypothetical protein BY996DRAFT_4075079 [Phakopsora pachyrhizi]|nr:hypothetical protein BY996DRAFT_4075079 [Phakopsora pachyrhizi]